MRFELEGVLGAGDVSALWDVLHIVGASSQEPPAPVGPAGGPGGPILEAGRCSNILHRDRPDG